MASAVFVVGEARVGSLRMGSGEGGAAALAVGGGGAPHISEVLRRRTRNRGGAAGNRIAREQPSIAAASSAGR